jgi:PPOX class probable F420-dependent enzyme
MDLDKAQRFLQANHRAVMHTRRASGDPQLSPVTVGVDADGRALVSSRETAVKAKNLARDARASLLVMNDQFYGEWIQVDGTVEIVHLPEAMDLLVEYYRQISGEHPDWDDYRAAMEREKRVILRLTIERAGPDVSG